MQGNAQTPSLMLAQHSHMLLIHDGISINWQSSSICGPSTLFAAPHQARPGHQTSVIGMQLCGGLWLPVIPSPLRLSKIIIYLFFASFYIPSEYFDLASSSSTCPLSSFCMLKYITSNLPISPALMHAHIHTLSQIRLPDRKSCGGV